jgi:dimethylaniline monooxygenase (N-oxide forming)
MVYRHANWAVDPNLTWAAFFEKLMTSRLAELMVRKPGEGLALSLLATVLPPIRWLIAMATEAYYKALMPMREHGMVPDHSFSAAMLGWRISVLPDRFYDMVVDGAIVLRRCESFGFRADGLVLDGAGGERVDADVVILATGFDADRLLSGVFVSPQFREIVVGRPSDTMLPLYRSVRTPSSFPFFCVARCSRRRPSADRLLSSIRPAGTACTPGYRRWLWSVTRRARRASTPTR